MKQIKKGGKSLQVNFPAFSKYRHKLNIFKKKNSQIFSETVSKKTFELHGARWICAFHLKKRPIVSPS